MRYGYNVRVLSEFLNIRQAEVRSFLHGQLPPGRTEELHHQLLAAGIPLSGPHSAVETHVATGYDRQVERGAAPASPIGCV